MKLHLGAMGWSQCGQTLTPRDGEEWRDTIFAFVFLFWLIATCPFWLIGAEWPLRVMDKLNAVEDERWNRTHCEIEGG